MRLLRLKINQSNGFRSLKKGFEIYFLREFHYKDATEFNPYILAGVNGSGKSNILEALAEIFFHLDCIYLRNRPDYFDKSKENPNGFDPKKSRIDAYEVEYFTFLSQKDFPEIAKENFQIKAHISIVKEKGKRPDIVWLNEKEFRDEPKLLTQLEVKSVLPEYVVGYASGNNETLSLPFFKSRFLQYDAYFSHLKAQEFVSVSPENSLIYLDEAFSQAILLTNLLMYDTINDETGTPIGNTVLNPFKEYVQLQDVDSFRLIIRTDKEIESDNEDLPADAPKKFNLIQNLDLQSDTKKVFVESYLEKLKRCATYWYHKNESLVKEDFIESGFIASKEYIVLDFKVNNDTKQAFQFHFEKNPLKLFELLQLLLVLDNNEISVTKKQTAYNSSNLFVTEDIHQTPLEEDRILRFKEVLIKKEHLSKPIYTKALSDGEDQFLHTLGLCLLFKDTRALFLLDEPETHFNPDWKAKFISSVRNCFEQEKEDSTKTMREMLITSHSPFLISDSKSDYVYVFKKDRSTGKVESVLHPDFQTFGSSINKIGIQVFGMPNTIGEYAQRKLDKFRQEFLSLKKTEDMETLIGTIKRELGDSVERVLLIHAILEKIEKS